MTRSIKKKNAQTVTRTRRRLLRGAILALCALLIVPIIQVAIVRYVDPPTTVPIILERIQLRPSPVRYEWKEIDQIPQIFLKHCLVAEDQRFSQHHGFDWREIGIARAEAEQKGKRARGASTITMQCARSLFLWQGRSWVRKALEAYYTFLMEMLWSKKRIIEVYANVIEMGDGIYGVEAGAKYRLGLPAQKLNREQSAMLVALLPYPKGWDPQKPTPALLARQQMILRRERGFVYPTSVLR